MSKKHGDISIIAKDVKSQWEALFETNPTYPDRAEIEASLPDLDPTPYFKHCKRLKIGFRELSLDREDRPYSASEKTLYCTVVDREESGGNLQEIFQEYKKKNCALCTQRSPRSATWTLSYEFLEEMSAFFEDDF